MTKRKDRLYKEYYPSGALKLEVNYKNGKEEGLATYKGYETQDSTFFNTLELNGDMSPTQAKRFFEKYELLNHQPNTSSGFSATLFQNKESKEYILAFRGTEPSDWKKDIVDADKDLALGKLASNQYIDMIKFYVECIEKEHITESTSLESL